MRARSMGWLLALVATHALVFFIARWQTTADTVDPAAIAEAAPAKASQRDFAGKSHRLALEDLEKTALSREEFVSLRRELFRDWVKRDLRGAMDMIYGVETNGRLGGLQWEIRDELKAAIARQADEVWQWIESGGYGSLRAQACNRWIDALAEDRQLEKLTATVLRMSGWESKAAVDAICARGKAEDLLRLRANLAATGEEYRLVPGMGSVVRLPEYLTRMVELTGDGMPELLANESNEDIREYLLEVWAGEHLSKRNPAEALALLSKLPEEMGREGLQEVFWTACQQGGFTTLVDLLEVSVPHGLWQGLEADEQENLTANAVSDAHQTYVQPAEMCRELQRISDPAIRRQVFEEAGKEIDPVRFQSEVLEAVAGMAAGADRDAFIMGMLSDCNSDEAVFGDLAGQLGDETLREEISQEMKPMEEEDP